MQVNAINRVTCEQPLTEGYKRVVTTTFYEKVFEWDVSYSIEQVAILYKGDSVQAQERKFLKFDSLDDTDQEWLKLLSREINVHGVTKLF